jgi:hypothetical protein
MCALFRRFFPLFAVLLMCAVVAAPLRLCAGGQDDGQEDGPNHLNGSHDKWVKHHPNAAMGGIIPEGGSFLIHRTFSKG